MIITGGKYKGIKIATPSEKITRPTLSKVRMGVFNTLFSIMLDFQDKSFLDLFGGSGIMGLEAYSRGFSDISVFEKNKQAVNVIKKNYQALNLTPNLKIGDSLTLVDNLKKKYDVVYIDPPYESGLYEDVLPKLIRIGKYIIAEHNNPINCHGFEILKEKNYGGKKVTFLYNTLF